MLTGVSKSGSPTSRWMTSWPSASQARARTRGLKSGLGADTDHALRKFHTGMLAKASFAALRGGPDATDGDLADGDWIKQLELNSSRDADGDARSWGVIAVASEHIAVVRPIEMHSHRKVACPTQPRHTNKRLIAVRMV